jgi:ABC-2 type transport system ATP-binding protein
MSDVVLEIKNLTRRFGAFTAVDALTLSVNAGEVFGLLGSNGAGKTTDLPHREQQARIAEALEFMNLTADAGRMVGEYSGGMVRRLEIAQSTLHRPKVLFLDEPTVGLDPIARDAVWKHLVDMRANYGTTLFFTTHYLEEAESHCDRMAIMHLGKVAALGTCKELEASLGAGHTLNDVFVHYAGSAIDSGNNFRAVSAERATAQRLG